MRALTRFIFVALVLAALPSQALATKGGPLKPQSLPPSPAVARLLNKAQAEQSAGHLKEALLALKLAAGMEPNNPMVLARLGIALVLNGEHADAEVELRRARSLGAPDEQILPPLFEAMLTDGKDQVVLDLFPDPDPTNRSGLAATILRARASALQRLGNESAAQVAIERALAIRRDYDVLMTAARIALLQQNWVRADALADEALKLSPNSTDVLIFKIATYLATNDQERALAISEKLVADQPRSLAARLARIKVYLAMGNLDKAKPDIDRIVKESPRMAIATYYRAFLLARSNKPVAAWSVAHVLPPEFVQGDAEVALNVAEMAAGAGFLDSAATLLSKAVFHNPFHLEARLKLVEYRLRQNSPQYALNTLAVVEDSKDPRVSILFALAYHKSGRSVDAHKYIERAIALGGGEKLALLGKDVALQSLRDWLQLHPDDLQVHRQYAVLLLRFGDLTNARIHYEQLVRLQPNDGVSLNNLSWLVLKDDPRRALALAVQAVKQDPSSPDFLDTLGCMQMNRSDFKGALDSLKRAHDLRTDDPQISYHLALALKANGESAPAKILLAAAVANGGFPDVDAAKKLLASWR